MPDYLPPPRWLLAVNRVLVALHLTDALRTRGRKSGRPRQLAVNVLARDGRRYLVAARGETEWVRNARATGTVDVRHGGRWRTYRVREVAAAQRPALIEAYLARWGWQVGAQFRALPRPEQHPVFELVPA